MPRKTREQKETPTLWTSEAIIFPSFTSNNELCFHVYVLSQHYWNIHQKANTEGLSAHQNIAPGCVLKVQLHTTAHRGYIHWSIIQFKENNGGGETDKKKNEGSALMISPKSVYNHLASSKRQQLAPRKITHLQRDVSPFTAVVIVSDVWALCSVLRDNIWHIFSFLIKKGYYLSMVLIHSFACSNGELLFNQDFPVNTEVK